MTKHPGSPASARTHYSPLEGESAIVRASARASGGGGSKEEETNRTSPKLLTRLERYFASRPPMAIAVSGGVDSMTLAVVAHRSQPGTEVYHAISPAVPADGTARVRAYASKEGWRLQVITAGEMDDPQYLANPANRCYHCKTSLYRSVTGRTALQVASGTNTDDLGDYRPGLNAAEEHQVCHPYVELGIGKAALRQIASELQLDDLKALPAAPCLSSRVTTGIAIDASLLPVIDAAEKLLWQRLQAQLPLKALRCRVRPEGLAIELDADQFDPASPLYPPAIAAVQSLFRQRGYADKASQVTIEPYQRGSAFLIDTVSLPATPGAP